MSVPMPPLQFDLGSTAASSASQGSSNNLGFTGGSINNGLQIPPWFFVAVAVGVGVYFYAKK